MKTAKFDKVVVLAFTMIATAALAELSSSSSTPSYTTDLHEYTPGTGESGFTTDSMDNSSSSTDKIDDLKPSTWTPVIVAGLFLAAMVVVGFPTIVADHLRQKEAEKIVPKRRYTLSLSLVEPNEANGFTRM